MPNGLRRSLAPGARGATGRERNISSKDHAEQPGPKASAGKEELEKDSSVADNVRVGFDRLKESGLLTAKELGETHSPGYVLDGSNRPQWDEHLKPSLAERYISVRLVLNDSSQHTFFINQIANIPEQRDLFTQIAAHRDRILRVYAVQDSAGTEEDETEVALNRAAWSPLFDSMEQLHQRDVARKVALANFWRKVGVGRKAVNSGREIWPYIMFWGGMGGADGVYNQNMMGLDRNRDFGDSAITWLHEMRHVENDEEMSFGRLIATERKIKLSNLNEATAVQWEAEGVQQMKEKGIVLPASQAVLLYQSYFRSRLRHLAEQFRKATPRWLNAQARQGAVLDLQGDFDDGTIHNDYAASTRVENDQAEQKDELLQRARELIDKIPGLKDRLRLFGDNVI